MTIRFKPGLTSSLITAICVAVMLKLGFWQVERLEWKEGLIARIEERATGDAVALPDSIDDPEALDYQRITLTGSFYHELTVRIGPRTYKGENGYHLITPLQRPDGSIVLVNRGWVPPEWHRPDDAPDTTLVSFTGIARLPETPGTFTPDNNPALGQWYWPDLPAMAQQMGFDDIFPLLVYAGASSGGAGDYPLGGQARLEMPNDHFQYAVFWFSMPFVLILIWVLYGLRRGKEIA